ncbi:MAG: superoxide dismutase [Chloroflexi bacterium]|nr:superoxide dismutase [Chloroflexota bacterium]
MAFTVKELKFSKDALEGISARTMETHHDRLYAGYVNKRNEITELLGRADRAKAAQTFSEYRELKLEETFNADGQILHELYFDCLGGNGQPTASFSRKVAEDFGSWENFVADATACAMAARGWAVTAYDPSDGRIHNFLCDAHNHGGVWGAIPLWTIDSYEHAYFMDYGSDRKSYINALLKNVDWSAVEQRYAAIRR